LSTHVVNQLNYSLIPGMVFASGLAATNSILTMFSAGDHVIAMDDLYGGTNRYFRKVVSRYDIEALELLFHPIITLFL